MKSLYDYVTVRPDERNQLVGVYLTETSKLRTADDRGVVVSSNADQIPVGSRVRFRAGAGEEFSHAGTRYRRVEVEDVLGREE